MRGTDSVVSNSLDSHSSSGGDAPMIRLDGLEILLVDDSFDNQLLFQRILTSAGASLQIARDGLEAVSMQASRDFDIILMDLMMPNIDGYEATRRIRAQGFTNPIIALTAHAAPGVESRCLEVGCTHFALKPIGRRDLLSAVHAAVKAAY